jgi:hypothetical protein
MLGPARRARARVARLSPLFNFTRGVPKGYLISWMGDSSYTHTVFLSHGLLILSLLQEMALGPFILTIFACHRAAFHFIDLAVADVRNRIDPSNKSA